jgi:serine/threonine protein kinase
MVVEMKTVKKVFLKGSLVGGRYRMLGRLGEGGMGIVYKAIDITLNTEVVLKVPFLNLAKESNFAERFKQELQSMIALSHPNIVRLLDLGEEEGVPYAVMPYLAGGDLNSPRPRDNSGSYLPVPSASLTEWLVPVAKALDFVHRKGIIHRDIKPSNILFDGEGNPFVTDFGIAKLVAEASDEEGKRMKTQTGVVLGTPDYTAPELIMGQAPEPSSDIFSLAMTVYELVTGKVPYADATPAAVLVKQVTEHIPSPKVFNPRLNDSFCHALLQGLQKAPSQRPKTALEFATAICGTLSLCSPDQKPVLPHLQTLGGTKPSQASPVSPVTSEDSPVFQISERKARRARSTPTRLSFARYWVFYLLMLVLVALTISAILYLTVFQLRLFGDPPRLVGGLNGKAPQSEIVVREKIPAKLATPEQPDLQKETAGAISPLIAEPERSPTEDFDLPSASRSTNVFPVRIASRVSVRSCPAHSDSAGGTNT